MTIYCPPEWQTDPAKVKRIGVVSGGVLYVFEHRDPRRGGPLAIQGVFDVWPVSSKAEDLVTTACEQGCGAVWMLPSVGPDWALFAQAVLHLSDYRTHELSADGALAGVVVQRASGGIPMGIYAPWINDAWGIAGTLTEDCEPYQLAEGLALAAFTLGAQLRFSPSYTGLTMLRQELADWERRRGPLPELSSAWRERLQELRPTYVQWRAPQVAPGWLLAAMRQTGADSVRLCQYDRNSSFVSSAREVPVGDPIEGNGEQACAAMMAGCPGVYHIQAVFPKLWEINDGELPGPFHVGEGVGSYPCRHFEGWAWEPQIRQARALGIEVGAIEGYYWPKGKQGGRVHDLFRPWQARFWDARNAARVWGGPSGALAEALVKKCGVATIGRLVQREGRAALSTTEARARGLRILARETDASGELTGQAEVLMDLGRTDLVQPAWWSTIIANANERLFHALYSHATQDAILAYVDGLWTLSIHPELAGDPRQPGAFRDAGNVRVPLADLARLDGLSAAELVKAFHRYGTEEVGAHGEEA